MFRSARTILLLLAATVPPSALIAQDRIPIDIGPQLPKSDDARLIDIMAPPVAPEPANAATIKHCEDQREAGVVAGEIVVCRELESDTAQLYSGSRAQWLKNYAERTQGANTIAPPDVAGEGIFRGPATVSGLCFIAPCADPPALMIDVEAIPPPPAGSDAERVAQGLIPREPDDAPLSDDARRQIAAELGLPEALPAQQEPLPEPM